MVHHNPNPSSEETLEELRRVVTALPSMPKNIVDDTRHEKVLSYVSAFIAQRDPVLMQTMLYQWSIIDTFQVNTLSWQSLHHQRKCPVCTNGPFAFNNHRRVWLQIRTTVSAVWRYDSSAIFWNMIQLHRQRMAAEASMEFGTCWKLSTHLF